MRESEKKNDTSHRTRIIHILNLKNSKSSLTNAFSNDKIGALETSVRSDAWNCMVLVSIE